MTSLVTRLVKVLGGSVVLLALAAPAWSQEQSGFAKEGPYVGLSTQPNFTLDGVTFDGQTIYKEIGGEEMMILPKLDQKRMFRPVVGYRSKWGAFEGSYDQTNHTGSFAGIPGIKATFHAINGDERIFLLPRSRFQPYVLLGGSIPWLTIEDGSFLDPDFGDATFKGFGVNTEAGVTVYATPRIAINAGYRYRAMWFTGATGVSTKDYELRPRFRETAGSAVIAGLFTF